MHPILALRAFFTFLFGGRLPETTPPKFLPPAAGEPQLEAPAEAKEPDPVEAQPEAKPEPEPEPTPSLEGAAAQTLGVLQREGRLLDFIFEDIEDYDDEDIGAAVREVHRGCRKALKEHFDLEPVRSEEEDSAVTVRPGFDPNEVRLVGNVVGEAPFSGTLKHKGWKASAARLPRVAVGPEAMVIAPAEVEL